MFKFSFSYNLNVSGGWSDVSKCFSVFLTVYVRVRGVFPPHAAGHLCNCVSASQVSVGQTDREREDYKLLIVFIVIAV